MMWLRALVLSAFLVAPPALVACGGGASCETLCEDAQLQSCTSIKGDCGAFCAALDNVEEPSGCGAQRDTYQDCLNEGANVCDNDCGSEETALSTCVGIYCQANASTPDCQTLISSF